ncbi:uncharacterized protein LOC129942290 [Eupeodes corollae]|uniref:uncharacterized protein LOC129942290 n=1 Tax=Eupeodes corollae TaxID=290404 RepID=UPI00248FED32|nr:uncharacterized protein LOC129942290 [Eupeodes corollae]
MMAQIKVLSTFLFIHCVASNEISFFKSSNYAHHARQYNNNNIATHRKLISSPSSASASPIQYLETPDYEIMLLTEENSNPTWRKYSELFQPKDMRTAPLFEKLHKQTTPSTLSTTTTTNGAGSAYNLDPVIDRILNLLDNDEQKMLDDLRKTFEKPTYSNNANSPPPQRRRKPSPPNRVSSSGISKNHHQKPKSHPHQVRDFLYKVPCNEGYVFLVESQKNPMNPSALSDLLLRVMKVVTKMS